MTTAEITASKTTSEPLTIAQQEFADKCNFSTLQLRPWKEKISSIDRDFIIAININNGELDEVVNKGDRVREIALTELKEKYSKIWKEVQEKHGLSKQETPPAKVDQKSEPEPETKTNADPKKKIEQNQSSVQEETVQASTPEQVKEEKPKGSGPSKNDLAMPRLFLPMVGSLVHGIPASMNHSDVIDLVQKTYHEKDQLFVQPLFQVLGVQTDAMKSSIKSHALSLLFNNLFEPIPCQSRGNHHEDAVARVLAQKYQMTFFNLPMGISDDEAKNTLRIRREIIIDTTAEKYADLFGQESKAVRELVVENFDITLLMLRTLVVL